MNSANKIALKKGLIEIFVILQIVKKLGNLKTNRGREERVDPIRINYIRRSIESSAWSSFRKAYNCVGYLCLSGRENKT